jgi:hypothetical protein
MKFTLWCCERCDLIFHADEPPSVCPQCRWYYSGEIHFTLAGRDVEVKEIKVYGKSPLLGKRVQRGLSTLDLGCACPHGMLHPAICHSCNLATI